MAIGDLKRVMSGPTTYARGLASGRLIERLLVLLLVLLLGFPTCGRADDDELPEPTIEVPRLAAAAFVSYWSLDPTGYHPAVLVRIVNLSGRDLSGRPIRLQAKFVDVRDGDRTTGNREIRQKMPPNGSMEILLRAKKDYQLPIDIHAWPPMECTVMARVGDVEDEGTQYLLRTKLEQLTLGDEEASLRMSKLYDFSQIAPPRRAAVAPPRPSQPQKPLSASAGSLKLPPHVKPAAQAAPARASTAAGFIANHSMPGLGDDFYNFEKMFGLPTETDTKDPGWTWAVFKLGQPELTVFTGSRGTTGKVDVVIAQVSASGIGKEAQVVEMGRAFAGKLKANKMGSLTPSVRYLPTGRLQIMAASATGYQFTYLPPRGAEGDPASYILILSRAPGAIDALMSEHSKRTDVLRPFKAFFGQS